MPLATLCTSRFDMGGSTARRLPTLAVDRTPHASSIGVRGDVEERGDGERLGNTLFGREGKFAPIAVVASCSGC